MKYPVYDFFYVKLREKNYQRKNFFGVRTQSKVVGVADGISFDILSNGLSQSCTGAKSRITGNTYRHFIKKNPLLESLTIVGKIIS